MKIVLVCSALFSTLHGQGSPAHDQIFFKNSQQSASNVHRSPISRKLSRIDNHHYHHNSASKHYWSYSLFNNPRGCSTWSVDHYLNAALQLFGKRYSRGSTVDVSSGYKRFFTDKKYDYYIHDEERYWIMEQWQLYDYPAFWAFIKKFPEYEACIMAIQEIMYHDHNVYNQLSQIARDRIDDEVKRIKYAQQQKSIAQAQKSIQKTFAGQSVQLTSEVSEYQEIIGLCTEYGVSCNDHLQEHCASLEDMLRHGLYTGLHRMIFHNQPMIFCKSMGAVIRNMRESMATKYNR